jgi:hypothetical protein
MDEQEFWRILEVAWSAAPIEARQRPPGKGDLEAVDTALESTVIPALRRILHDLPAAELAAFDRVLERKLFDLDRVDVQARTDGSDDGFLYARGFIVAMGRPHWEAVMEDPARAFVDRECAAICYLPKDLYELAHGPLEPSGISRETGANRAGWRKR